MDRIGVYAYCGFDVPAEERFKKVKEAGFQKVAVWCNTGFSSRMRTAASECPTSSFLISG